jgi:NAD(P)-dependent dehydrogenase (short-subunit alcohol dehydrogenase family)
MFTNKTALIKGSKPELGLTTAHALAKKTQTLL